MNTQIVNLLPFTIPDESLFNKMGRKRKTKLSSRIKNNVTKATLEVEQFAEPKAMYKVVSLENEDDTILLDGVQFESKKLHHLLEACDKVVVFLITLGEKVDELVRKHSKEQPHYGYILDSAASIAVESAAQHFQKLIEEKVNGQGQTSLRYSPGYCDWPLSEQKKIFEILPHEKFDINLSDTFLMSPLKSITGIIGIASNCSEDFVKSTCELCNKIHCQYKRTAEPIIGELSG